MIMAQEANQELPSIKFYRSLTEILLIEIVLIAQIYLLVVPFLKNLLAVLIVYFNASQRPYLFLKFVRINPASILFYGIIIGSEYSLLLEYYLTYICVILNNELFIGLILFSTEDWRVHSVSKRQLDRFKLACLPVARRQVIVPN